MKFVSSIKQLGEAVSHANLMLPNKLAEDRYKNLSMTLGGNQLTLFISDGEFSLKRHLTVEGNEDGEIAIDASVLNSSVTALYDGNATFTLDRNSEEGTPSFVIKTKIGTYQLANTTETLLHEDPLQSKDLELTLEMAVLREFIDNTLFAVSLDMMRPSMTGVLFEIEPKQVRAVATDGQRLVRSTKRMDTEVKEKVKLIIPHRVLGVFNRVMPESGMVTVMMDLKHSRIAFECGDSRLIAPLIAENYPNYEAVIPLENDKKLTIKRSDLLSSLKRVSRYSERRDVRLQLNENQMMVTTGNSSKTTFAEEILTCGYSSESLLIGFKADLITDALDHLSTDEVMFEFSSPTRATIIRPKQEEKKGDDLLMLVMPYRLNT